MHYSDVITGAIASQITVVYYTVYSDAENIKAPRHSRTNGQWRGKCFHFMAPLWSWRPTSLLAHSRTWWRHQMETFSALLAICAGIHRSPVNSPHEGQWRGALKFSLICVWINGWVNNREVGDFRRYSAHYDVTVMCVPNCAEERTQLPCILFISQQSHRHWQLKGVEPETGIKGRDK